MKLFGGDKWFAGAVIADEQTQTGGPTNVLDAASRVTTALTTTALYATDPLAHFARKAAGEELGELHQRLPCGGRQGPVHRSFAPSCPMASSRSLRLSSRPWTLPRSHQSTSEDVEKAVRRGMDPARKPEQL